MQRCADSSLRTYRWEQMKPDIVSRLLRACCAIHHVSVRYEQLRRGLAAMASGHLSQVQLRKVRTRTKPAKSPRLGNVSSMAIVLTMSAATNTSRPSSSDLPMQMASGFSNPSFFGACRRRP
jgi:hypothetical protein